ncbi:MAG: hypothetical protein MRY83_20470 [Flavobacteriales bacterium]|nr:hypothetical protein [Flavobacteriales bacterium]
MKSFQTILDEFVEVPYNSFFHLTKTISVFSQNSSGNTSEEVLNAFKVLIENPVQNFDKFGFNYINPVSFEHNEACKIVAETYESKNKIAVELKATSEGEVAMTATFMATRTFIKMGVRIYDNELIDNLGIESLITWAKEMHRNLPNAVIIKVGCFGSFLESFYEDNNLPISKPPFGDCMDWYGIYATRGFLSRFDKDEVLNLPAFEVIELENDFIEIRAFENPSNFEEVEKRSAEISNHLNTIAKKSEHELKYSIINGKIYYHREKTE